MNNGLIFISYRRNDSYGTTGRIYDRLKEHFGHENIFMDVDTIAPGEDFVEAIENAVSNCDIVVVIIGKDWLHITDRKGHRLIENSSDFVRTEIKTALQRKIKVIPVLVQDAVMPNPEDLPDDLKPLARKNAIELDHTRFASDVDRLIKAVQKTLEEVGKTKGKKDETKVSGAINQLDLNNPSPVVLQETPTFLEVKQDGGVEKDAIYKHVVLIFFFTQLTSFVAHVIMLNYYEFREKLIVFVSNGTNSVISNFRLNLICLTGATLLSSIIPFVIFFYFLKSYRKKTTFKIRLFFFLIFLCLPVMQILLYSIDYAIVYDFPFFKVIKAVVATISWADWFRIFLPCLIVFSLSQLLKIKQTKHDSIFRRIVLPFFLSLLACTLYYYVTFGFYFVEVDESKNAPISDLAYFVGFSVEVLLLQFMLYAFLVKKLSQKYTYYQSELISLLIFSINIIFLLFKEYSDWLDFIVFTLGPFIIILITNLRKSIFAAFLNLGKP